MNKIIKFCLFVVIFSLCSKKEEPEVLEVVNISNTPGRSENPAIACDSRDYFYVVWEDRAPNGIKAVYSTERPPGGDWTQPTYILEPQTPLRQPDIAVDRENTLHVVGQYSNPQGWGEIFYTKKPLNGNWTTPEIIGMYGEACMPKIAVDNYGDVHVVWRELVGYWPIIYSKRAKNGSWSTPVEISKNLGVYNYTIGSKIAVDQSSYAHVIWTQCINYGSDLEDVLVYTTNAPSGAWSEPMTLCHDSYLTIGGSQQIVVDDNQTVHVVWSMRRDIFYTSKSLSSNWSAPARVCSTEAISSTPNLGAINNELHVFWEEGIDYDTLCYSKKENGDNWNNLRKFVSTNVRRIGVADFDFGSTTIGIVFGAEQPPNRDNEEIYFCEIPRE